MSYKDGEEYPLSEWCSFKVDFYAIEGDSFWTLAPTVSRWDANTVSNPNGYLNDGLSEPNGSWGFWAGFKMPDGSGWRTVDDFARRLYPRTHSDQNIHLAIDYFNIGTYANGWVDYPNGSADWVITIPALDSYSVTYDANGGKNAPDAQTKWWGETLTLSTTTPTRENYKFLGWATGKTATEAEFTVGGSYTDNKEATLYAVWQLVSNPPTQTVTLGRCNADGTPNGEGTHVKATVAWSVDNSTAPTNEGKQIDISWETSARASGSQTFTISGTSGTLSAVLDGTFDGGTVYSFTVKTTDTLELSTSTTKTIGSIFHTFDIGNAGQSMGLGAMASDSENRLDIGYDNAYVHGGHIYGEVVLFNNPDQPMSGAITLNQDCTQFKRLRVICKDDGGKQVTTWCEDPAVGTHFMAVFEMAGQDANAYVCKSSIFKIEATNRINFASQSGLGLLTGSWFMHTGSLVKEYALQIIKVIGYA